MSDRTEATGDSSVTASGQAAGQAQGQAQADEHLQVCRDLINEVAKVVVGQEEMISRLIVGLLTGGHVLLEGVPGLAKTLTVRSLAWPSPWPTMMLSIP